MHGAEIAETVAERYGATSYRVLGRAPVLWSGWECDTDVVVVELHDGRRELVGVGATQRLGRAELLDRVREYREAVTATMELVGLLDESRGDGDSR